MKLDLNFLSEDEKHRIHRDSLKILSQVGVKYLSNNALKVLEKNGAGVNYDTRIAKIPEEMVNEALNRAPKSFVLGARNPEFDFAMPSSFTSYIWNLQSTMCRFSRFPCHRPAPQVLQAFIQILRLRMPKAFRPWCFSRWPRRECRLFSDEFYSPALGDRNTFERWEAMGSPTLYGKARKRVEEILAGPQKNPLPADVLGKLEDIVRRANEELPSET